MSRFVLDCSITLAWVFPDEISPDADAIRRRLYNDAAVVPSLWRLEVSNGLTLGERKGRFEAGKIRDFLSLLSSLPIEIDGTASERALGPVLELARQERLTAYDAAYLDLAITRGVGLATADRALAAAAQRRGVTLVDGKGF